METGISTSSRSSRLRVFIGAAGDAGAGVGADGTNGFASWIGARADSTFQDAYTKTTGFEAESPVFAMEAAKLLVFSGSVDRLTKGFALIDIPDSRAKTVAREWAVFENTSSSVATAVSSDSPSRPLEDRS